MLAKLICAISNARASITGRLAAAAQQIAVLMNRLRRPRHVAITTRPIDVDNRTVRDLLTEIWGERWSHHKSWRQVDSVLWHFLGVEVNVRREKPRPRTGDALAHVRLDALTRDTVRRWHASHFARGRSANRALELLSQAWDTAFPEVPNPCKKITRFAERVVSRRFSDSECARFVQALGDLRLGRNITEIAADVIWTLLATGCRKQEILELQCDQVDLVAGTIVIRRHKSDGRTDAKTVHLGAALPEVQRRVEMARAAGSRWVFPGRSDAGHFSDPQYAFFKVCKHAGIVSSDGLVLHSIRHRFATILADAGVGLPLIGACLGHADPKTTARYARPSLDATKRVVDQVTASLGAPAWRAAA